MMSGCERIHCGLAGDKIVSYGHCLFQLMVDGKHPLSFFDLAGYHEGSPSNLTLNRLLQILYHRNRNRAQFKLDSNLNVHSIEPGLIPNLQRILQSGAQVDVNCVLHISDDKAQLEHTLKTMQIARMFAKARTPVHATDRDSIECFEVEATMKKDFADKLDAKTKRIEELELKVTELEGEVVQLKKGSKGKQRERVVSFSEIVDLGDDEEHTTEAMRRRRRTR